MTADLLLGTLEAEIRLSKRQERVIYEEWHSEMWM